MNNRSNWISAVLLTAALVLALVAPALAASTATATSAAPASVSYPTPTMSRLLQPSLPIAAFTVATATPAPAAHRVAAKPAAKPTVARRSSTKTASVRPAAKSGGTRPAAAAPASTSSAPSSSSNSGSNDLTTAESVLAGLKATYKYLDGVTVEVGTTPGGYQAVSYFTTGRIVISSKHTVSIRTIMKHEIWHIIDWRDNGHIDWGENIPPANAASYRL